jgi:hypothetical protein
MTHRLPLIALLCLPVWVGAQVITPALTKDDVGNIYVGSSTAPCSTKSCAVYPVNVATCTPKLMGGSGVNTQVGGGISGAWLSTWCPSAKGPQLRILAGTWIGTLAAVDCINRSGKTPAQALPMCAPESPFSKGLLPIWRDSVGPILASRP